CGTDDGERVDLAMMSGSIEVRLSDASSISSMRVLVWHSGAAPRGRAGARPSQGAVAAMSLPGTSPPGTSFLGTSSTSSMDGLAGNAADELVLDEMVSSLSLLRRRCAKR